MNRTSFFQLAGVGWHAQRFAPDGQRVSRRAPIEARAKQHHPAIFARVRPLERDEIDRLLVFTKFDRQSEQ